MKLCFISDTHEQHRWLQIPKCDVLVHTGDHAFQNYGTPGYRELPNLLDYSDWCRDLLEQGIIKHAVTIAGNHDRAFEDCNAEARAALGSYVTYLQDEGIVIGGKKFWGTPWTPRYYDWGFQLDSDEHAREVWKDVPSDVDVLLTHGPAFGWLDENPNKHKCGCKELERLINRIQPAIHAHGHIHQSHGVAMDSSIGTLRVNGASCTEKYKPNNKPIVVELR